MFETFFPDEYVASTYVIPFDKLYEDIKNYKSEITRNSNLFVFYKFF